MRILDDRARDVYLDWFNLPAGVYYFDMTITPDAVESLVHWRGEHYYDADHWIDIFLFITDRNSKGKCTPDVYLMHYYISDNDGNGYYVTVYFDQDGGSTFEQSF